MGRKPRAHRDRPAEVELGVAGDELMRGTPQVLLEMPVAQPQRATWYDVSTDVSGLVVLADDEVLTHVTVQLAILALKQS